MKNINFLPPALQPVARRYWQRCIENKAFNNSGLESLLEEDSSFADELFRVWIASDFIAKLCIKNPSLVTALYESKQYEVANKATYGTELAQILAPLRGMEYQTLEIALKTELRCFHQREFLRIVWRDVCAKASLFETCEEMSHLADACINGALELLHQCSMQEWGSPTGPSGIQSMYVLAMGKLGAYELNISSDIDLIFTYPEMGETVTDPQRHVESKPQKADSTLTNQQYFTSLGQRLIDSLGAVTEDGFVFRVDMRLRPYGAEGALVLSFDAMEDYYQNQGRDWERYALVKARVCTGSKKLGKELLARLKPTIYRRYTDFSALESLRLMKQQIHKQVRRKKLEKDIKLGAGGIREIEFIVQSLQLIHGGRDIRLQNPSIDSSFTALADGKYLEKEIVAQLREAYIFLRELEHKLQEMFNQQTQTLPENELVCLRIAFALNFTSWAELEKVLDRYRSNVSQHFANIIQSRNEAPAGQEKSSDTPWFEIWALELEPELLVQELSLNNYEDPQHSSRLLKDFKKDKQYFALENEGRKRVDQFMPVLLEAVSHSVQPSLCLARVLKLIKAVIRRTAYLVLLLENPRALEQLVLFCTASPFITDFLSKYPVLLDELMSITHLPPEKSELRDELSHQLLRIEDGNFEEQMESLRYFKQSHLLQIAAAEVTGSMPIMKVSDYLTSVAEVVLEQVLALSWEFLVSKYGYPVHTDGSFGELEFIIIAYGKLGGYELSYDSDLDLVFLHAAALNKDTVWLTDSGLTTDTGASTTQKRLNSREFYVRLAQRIIVMLGTRTVSGVLYEADMRLRPSGEAGLLVSSIDAFNNYQNNEAWTWEHQALVRARSVTGCHQLQKKFTIIRQDVLSKHRDSVRLSKEVVAMREKMRTELKTSSSSEVDKQIFAIKQEAGGIVDIEFIVQYLVLVNSCSCRHLLSYTDNVRILEAVDACELISKNDLRLLTAAYLSMRSVSHQLSLQRGEMKDKLVVSRPNEDYRQAVIEIWQRIFNP